MVDVNNESELDFDSELDYDVHSCSAECDVYGICTVCGSIVRGTLADFELHGYDPSDTW